MSILVERAIRLAVEAHSGQVDKVGDPYIHHPLRVLELVRRLSDDEAVLAAAVLHDVLEDTKVSKAMLIGCLAGLAPEARQVPDFVVVLTRNKDWEYEHYVQRIAAIPRAALIKWADSTDNWARLGNIDDHKQRVGLRKRYERNFDVLGETAEQEVLRKRHRDLMNPL